MKNARFLLPALAAILFPFASFAETFTETVDGIKWFYTLSIGEASVGSDDLFNPQAIPTTTTGAIVVPATLGGCPVTSIRDNAFLNCSGLTSVTIPDSVTSIEYSAFKNCSGLTSIMIPDSVTRIGGSVFDGCSDAIFDTTTMRGVRLVDGWAIGTNGVPVLSGYLDLSGVRGIGGSAFSGCSALTAVLIPDGVASIGTSAFRSCSGLRSITIPDSVKTIGGSAFSDCSSLASVMIGSGVTDIGHRSFQNCSSLTSVTIPEGVRSVGDQTFQGCSRLATVSIPDSMARIGKEVFDGCAASLFDTTTKRGIRLVDGWAIGTNGVPVLSGILDLSGVRGIGGFAFYHCSGLTSVTIPNGVASIGERAFQYCSGLTTITIPDSVMTIGDGAFAICSGLPSISIPDGVTTIGDSAFYGCSGLTSITIPDSVTSIGERAFQLCSSLERLSLPARFYGQTADMGIPSGCEVVFPVLLLVSSAVDAVSPSVGSHGLFVPDAVVCKAPPVFFESSQTKLLCKGWTGTGSVPAGGTGTNVTFSIMEDSTLTWLWETNVWIECAVSGDAAGSFAGWVVKDGASVVVPFETDVKRYTVATSGDTTGVVVDMDAKAVTIPADAPHAVSVTIAEVVGTGAFPLSWSDPAGFAAWSMVEEESVDDGWCLKSDAIAVGETAATEISVEGPGLVEFDWKISANRGDYARVYADGTAAGSLSRSTAWTHAAVEVKGAGVHIVRWTYERQAPQAAGADAAFLDNVQWRPARTLEVSSVAGDPSPKRGSATFYHGDEVTATVAETEPPHGTRCTYLGWTGTGSVPASGTATNVTFEITEDSAIAWNWLVEHRIEFRPAGAVDTGFTSAWAADGGTVVVPYQLLAGCDSLVLGGDTTGVALDETARTVTIPADGPRTVTLRTNKAIPLEDALDAPAIGWSTDAGAAAWLGQDSDTSDGEDAATSGAPAGTAGSVLTATVPGPGTLSWKWKLVSDGVAGVDVILDDGAELAAFVEGACDWTDESIVVEGEGPHSVKFLFWCYEAGDHAVIDRVAWTGAAAKAATQATPAPVPFTWLSGYGLAADGNYGAAAFAPAANGIDDVWQCYVSGISPVDPAARFLADIRVDGGGSAAVTPVPDLGAARRYEVLGKAALDDYDWGPTNAASRFFRVRVLMP